MPAGQLRGVSPLQLRVIQRVLFEPEASAELEEAARWYEAQRSGWGWRSSQRSTGAVEHLAV